MRVYSQKCIIIHPNSCFFRKNRKKSAFFWIKVLTFPKNDCIIKKQSLIFMQKYAFCIQLHEWLGEYIINAKGKKL